MSSMPGIWGLDGSYLSSTNWLCNLGQNTSPLQVFVSDLKNEAIRLSYIYGSSFSNGVYSFPSFWTYEKEFKRLHEPFSLGILLQNLYIWKSKMHTEQMSQAPRTQYNTQYLHSTLAFQSAFSCISHTLKAHSYILATETESNLHFPCNTGDIKIAIEFQCSVSISARSACYKVHHFLLHFYTIILLWQNIQNKLHTSAKMSFKYGTLS